MNDWRPADWEQTKADLIGNCEGFDAMIEGAADAIVAALRRKPTALMRCTCSRCTGIPDADSYYLDDEAQP